MLLRILDLYSGIGGFSKAFEDVSSEHFKTQAFCEFDKNAQLVLRKHWPLTPIFEDVRTLPSGIAELLAVNKQLEQELQKTRYRLEKAEKVINSLMDNTPHYDECSFMEDENCECNCGREIDIKVARQYFKDKQGEG